MYEIPLIYGENGTSPLFKLIDSDTRAKSKKLGIEAFATVFVGGTPVNALARGCDFAEYVTAAAANGKRIDFCRMDEADGVIVLSEPQLVTVIPQNAPRNVEKRLARKNKRHEKMFAFRRRRLYEKINRTLDTARFCIINAYMKAALSDRMFIARFNENEFYNHLSLKGGKVSSIEADVLMTGKTANKFVNVSEKAVRTANIVLYAIACKGFRLEDFYSVDAVFTFQEGRERDSKKSEAANEFFGLIYGAKKDKILDAYVAMAETLGTMPLLPVNMRDMKLLRESYVLYSALSNLALGFERALTASSDFRRLVRKRLIKRYWTLNERIIFLTGYRKITDACEKIAAADDYNSEELLLSFEEACNFEYEVSERIANDSSAAPKRGKRLD